MKLFVAKSKSSITFSRILFNVIDYRLFLNAVIFNNTLQASKRVLCLAIAHLVCHMFWNTSGKNRGIRSLREYKNFIMFMGRHFRLWVDPLYDPCHHTSSTREIIEL